MYVPDTPYNVFHNVVIKELANGAMYEPFVFRYEVKEDYWPTYFSSDRMDAPFYGDVQVYSISSFETINLENKNGKSREPCYTHTSTSDSSGSSGSGSGGSSGNGSGNGSWGSWGNSGTQGSFTLSGVLVRFVSSGGIAYGGEIVLLAKTSDKDWQQKFYSAKSGECPDDDILAAINEAVDVPPSCKSFDFKEVTSVANWQAACVKDFEMGVGVYTLSNLQSYRIKIPLLTFET